MVLLEILVKVHVFWQLDTPRLLLQLVIHLHHCLGVVSRHPTSCPACSFLEGSSENRDGIIQLKLPINARSFQKRSERLASFIVLSSSFSLGSYET